MILRLVPRAVADDMLSRVVCRIGSVTSSEREHQGDLVGTKCWGYSLV